MKPFLLGILLLLLALPCAQAVEPFDRVVDLIERRCGECHTGNAAKGGFSMNSRQSLLHGSDNGKVLQSGKDQVKNKNHLLLDLLNSQDDDEWMPPKGKRLTAEEITLFKQWINDGLTWKAGFVFNNARKAATAYLPVKLPPGTQQNPIDRFLNLPTNQACSDALFIRRATLDLTGLLPDPEQVENFVKQTASDKRAQLIDQLLADKIAYADHWLTFWNDLLRNSYYGTGFIDNGRQQITAWLYQSLLDNKRYDQFTTDLITGAPGAEGYIKGIVWRGVVNASQRPVIQAAQNVSQVFLGTNLKCASCHDSFIDGWKLDEAYAFASIFSPTGKLQVVHCNRVTKRSAQAAMLFPELGRINANAPLAERRQQAAALLTSDKNGLFARTLVNRMWKNFFAYGLVEPVDFMANPSWNEDLLNWLAEDFKQHHYDLKHLMRRICTSHAYSLPAIGNPNLKETSADDYSYVFRGPYIRRMTAEQLLDAVGKITGTWNQASARDKDPEKKFRGQGGQYAELLKIQRRLIAEDEKLQAVHQGKSPIELTMRASAAKENDFMRILGRPAREQVVTQRDGLATTLQALELTNGKTFDDLLRQGAKTWLAKKLKTQDLITRIHLQALGRKPTQKERLIATQMLPSPTPSEQALSDYLWVLLALPEFELIY